MQADNAMTCRVPEFIHSISAQMSQCPQLTPYFHLIQVDREIVQSDRQTCRLIDGQIDKQMADIKIDRWLDR